MTFTYFFNVKYAPFVAIAYVNILLVNTFYKRNLLMNRIKNTYLTNVCLFSDGLYCLQNLQKKKKKRLLKTENLQIF